MLPPLKGWAACRHQGIPALLSEMLQSFTVLDMQPPDPALLIGHAMSAPNQAPAPDPEGRVIVAAQAGAIPKTVLGIVLGIGIPLTLGLGMSDHIYFFTPVGTAYFTCISCCICCPINL